MVIKPANLGPNWDDLRGNDSGRHLCEYANIFLYKSYKDVYTYSISTPRVDAAPIAQMVRASVLCTGGRGFNPLWVQVFGRFLFVYSFFIILRLSSQDNSQTPTAPFGSPEFFVNTFYVVEK